MSVKLGPSIHPVQPAGPTQIRQYSAQEKAELDAFLFDTQPDAALVLNEFKWVQRFADMLPKTTMIFRKVHDQDGALWKLPGNTPRAYFLGMQDSIDPRIRLNLSNEPFGYTPVVEGKPDYGELERMVAWHCESMDIFGAAGVGLILPNWSVLNPDMGWFVPASKEWSLVKPLFDTLQKWPLHALGFHQYFRKEGVPPGNAQVGRHVLVMEALGRLGYAPFDSYITEYGADGWGGMLGPWMDAYGATDEGEDAYSRELTAGMKKFSQSYVKGVILYCWGAYAKWARHNIAHARRLQESIVLYNRMAANPPGLPVDTPPQTPPETPPPPPEKPAEPERKVHTWTITLTATDEEAAQASALVMLALDAMSKLAGAAVPVKDLLSRIVVHDMSKEAQV